jgi:hypothetical protein
MFSGSRALRKLPHVVVEAVEIDAAREVVHSAQSLEVLHNPKEWWHFARCELPPLPQGAVGSGPSR